MLNISENDVKGEEIEGEFILRVLTLKTIIKNIKSKESEVIILREKAKARLKELNPRYDFKFKAF